MKLIVNRENDPATRSKIRRGFAEKDSKAYMLLLELISHQSGFSTSKEYLCELLGWTAKIWKDEAKKLELRGHLFRYRQTGTQNWTFVVYENPQSAIIKKEKKVIEINIEEPFEIKKEDKLAGSTLFTEQEKEEIKKQVPKKYEVLTPKINLII